MHQSHDQRSALVYAVFLPYIVRWLGLELLDMAHAPAECDWPARIPATSPHHFLIGDTVAAPAQTWGMRAADQLKAIARTAVQVKTEADIWRIVEPFMAEEAEAVATIIEVAVGWRQPESPAC